jgi:DNA-binding MarR family transcriptional regulator
MADPVPSVATPAAFYTPDTLRSDNNVGLLMKRAVQSMRQSIDRGLAPHGLTQAQWLPLVRIAHGGCTTIAALARDQAIDPGAMTRAVDRLQAKGLLRRERSAPDRRVVTLVLTDAGRAAAALVPPVAVQALNAHLAGFSHAEWQQLVGLLTRVLANGDALREPERDAP